jgi:hypothetical protein
MRVRLNNPANEQRSAELLSYQELESILSPRSRALYADPQSVSGVLDGSA